MDGVEGWRSIRYEGGVQDKTTLNRIMLRFRPIAPKPTAGGPLPGGSPVLKENVFVSKRRTKRKYVRVGRTSKGCNTGKETPTVASEEMKNRSATTLQLLPDNCTEQKASPDCGSWCSKFNHMVTDTEDQEDGNPFIRLNLNLMREYYNESSGQTAVIAQTRRAAETWVAVEYVRETCMDGRGLGCTDMERLTNLEGDTCPGFLSDGLNRVLWVNGAFRKLVSLNQQGGADQERKEEPVEIEVRLGMKEMLPYRAFTCQVRVQNTWGKDRYSQMVPCDAWRMDGGGFAWRLDVKAALSLGR